MRFFLKTNFFKNLEQFIRLKIFKRNNIKQINSEITGIKTMLGNLKYQIYDEIKNSEFKFPKIISKEITIEKIIESNLSISRFGDGEFNLAMGISIPFQEASEELSLKLKNILKNENQKVLVCIPDVFASLEKYKQFSVDFWRKYIAENRQSIYKILDFEKEYHDAFLSRAYIPYKDKSQVKNYFSKMKNIWNNRDIVFIEGEKSRLGIENDLFDNAKSIKRILCPSLNAYSKYDKIFQESKKLEKDSLILIALGPTATILAYELALEGYQSLDIGHIDIEYEWFHMQVDEPVPIKNKYTLEANGTKIKELNNNEYLQQIICEIN